MEVREAVKKYDAKSPLYGLVQYRRKKIILKYVPEGTSRLLQGKTAASGKHKTRMLQLH